MKRTLTVLAAMGLVASLALVGPLSAQSGNKYGPTTRSEDCGSDGSMTVEINGPEKLWPPNHKYVPVTITATDEDGDDVSLATEGTHDQYDGDTEINGAGHTADDVSPAADSDSGAGEATTSHDVRAERSGRIKEGRVYTISYEASGGSDDSCMGSFTITVPHDMRGGADWK
jgi:hypothetical protein